MIMAMFSRIKMKWLALPTVWLCFASAPAISCQVCVPLPTETAADQIIAASEVVLARENPDKPYSFRAVDVIKGEISNPDIDLFANSGVRRLLAADQERVVVLVRKSGLAWDWQTASTRAWCSTS